MLLASDYAENSRDRTVCLCMEQSPDVSCNGGLAKSTAAAPLESLRQISILTGSVGSSCAPLRERQIIHRHGDTHWYPTHFWTSTVSCVTLRPIEVLDELPTPNIFIVLPTLTHSNDFRGTFLSYDTIRYRSANVEYIEKSMRRTTAYPFKFTENTAKYQSDLVDTTNSNRSES